MQFMITFKFFVSVSKGFPRDSPLDLDWYCSFHSYYGARSSGVQRFWMPGANEVLGCLQIKMLCC